MCVRALFALVTPHSHFHFFVFAVVICDLCDSVFAEFDKWTYIFIQARNLILSEAEDGLGPAGRVRGRIF